MKTVAIHFVNGEIRTMDLGVYLQIRKSIGEGHAAPWQLVNNDSGFQIDLNLSNIAFIELLTEVDNDIDWDSDKESHDS